MQLIALLVAASGCSSYQPPPQSVPPPTPAPPRAVPDMTGGGPLTAPPPSPRPLRPPSARPPGEGERAVELARSLLETPYRYGGEDRGGFDCSGLVTWVFSRLGIELPRTAEDQAGAGRWVAADELRPGDLVFFGDRREKPDHVGLVVSGPGASLAMIHAATSRGVVETDVSRDGYWLRRFKFGRRVLDPD